MVPAFTSFVWTSCYSEPGSFELYLMYDKEIFKALMVNAKYIFRSDTKKIGYIQNIKKSKKTSGGSTILISGPQLEGVLQKYVFMSISSVASGELSLVDWVKSSFINVFYPYAKIDDTFGSDLMYTLSGTEILSSNAQSLLYSMFKKFEVSLTHEKQGDAVVFRIWRGRNRTISQPDEPILLSEKIGNIQNVQYERSEAGCYNTVLGTGYTELIEAHRENGISYIYPESAERRSIDQVQTHFDFDLSIIESEGPSYRVDEYNSHQRFITEAVKHIVPVSESFSAEMVDSSLVELGDIISIKDDDTGIIYDKRVEKIVESYNANSIKKVITFGDSIRTIKNVVNKSMGME